MMLKDFIGFAWMGLRSLFFILLSLFVGFFVGDLLFAGQLILPAVVFLVFITVMLFWRPCLHLEKYPVLSTTKTKTGKHYHCWNCGRYVN